MEELEKQLNSAGSHFSGHLSWASSSTPTHSRLASDTITIPIKGSSPLVVHVEDLPEDSKIVKENLTKNDASLSIWLQFVLAYYRQGYIAQFLDILTSATHSSRWSSSKDTSAALLCIFGSYYTLLSQKNSDEKLKKEFLSQAMDMYAKAQSLGDHAASHIGHGLAFLLQGQTEKARPFFEFVLETVEGRSSIPGLVGLGCVLYQEKRYKEAIATFKKALQIQPDATADVRLGIGLCQYQMGNLDLAKKAFERVLELDPKQTHALVGLSIILFHEGLKFTEQKSSSSSAVPPPPSAVTPTLLTLDEQIPIMKSCVKKALENVVKAYHLDPTLAPALVVLSDHFFHKNMIEQSAQFAKKAIENASTPQVKAESYFLLARCSHIGEDYQTALDLYRKSVGLNDQNPLALYGLGQIILRTDRQEALKIFEKVLKMIPDAEETIKVVAFLYSESSNPEDRLKGIGYFKRLLELTPSDHEVYIHLAELTEVNSPKQALKYYQRALEVLRQNGRSQPAEIYNNVGSLLHKLEKYDLAEASYLRAIKENDSTLEEFSDKNITISYNLGRLYEDQFRYEDASRLYKGIIKQHPNYIDCFLRLGIMARDRGLRKEAENWFGETLKIDPDNKSALCLLGRLYAQRESWKGAQDNFEKVLGICEKTRAPPDTYASLSLADMYYRCSFTNPEKKQRFFDHAFSFYKKVLKREPKNLYAANGMAVMIGERGHLPISQEYMIQVREAASDYPEAWENLAHIYAAQKHKITEAIKLYQKINAKFYNNQNSRILVHLAKAYYDAKRLSESRITLLKAVHIDANDPSLWFNVALCLQKEAEEILSKPRKSIADVEKAIASLKEAERSFNNLAEGKPSIKYSRRKAKEHAEYCNLALSTTQEHLEAAKIQEKEEEERRRKTSEEEGRKEAERVRERERLNEEEARRKKEEEDSISEVKNRMAEIFRMAEEEVEMKRKKKREESEDEEEEERRKKKKRGRKKGKKKRREEESEEEEEEEESDEGEEGEEKALEKIKRKRQREEEQKTHGRKKKKRKMTPPSSPSSSSSSDLDFDLDAEIEREKREKERERRERREQEEEEEQSEKEEEEQSEKEEEEQSEKEEEEQSEETAGKKRRLKKAGGREKEEEEEDDDFLMGEDDNDGGKGVLFSDEEED